MSGDLWTETRQQQCWGIRRFHPDNLEWLTHRAGQALPADFATARELIERIWLLDGEAELLHQLLFVEGPGQESP